MDKNNNDCKSGLKALLTLADGFTLEGRSVNGEAETGGEVIFTTAMTGYQEVLTDPSYCGQMICMTYPHIGNYGINDEDNESAAVHCKALLVKECCKKPSSFRSKKSLPEFLAGFDVPIIEGLDTRALTTHLRKNGAMAGIISTNIADPDALRQKAAAMPGMRGQKLVPRVACKEPWTWVDGAPARIGRAESGAFAFKGAGLPLLVYDYGVKWNILRHLVQAGFEPVCVPPDFSPQDVRNSGAKAVFLSNGPGDPATLDTEVAIIAELMKEMPVTGICLGHQIIAQALGARTDKLKFGHHGCNHPVKDLVTGKIEISSQNHGFHVILDDVQQDVEATHVNLNDHTLEGLRHKTLPVMSLQYHPEAAAGPRDSNHLFNRFRQMVGEALGN